MPTLPPRSRYTFAVAGTEQGEDLVGVGADLAPGTILEAYVAGVFPMGLGDYGGEPLGWWSPDPRGVLLPANLHVSRSMHRAMHRFEIRVDSDFAGVVAGCADPGRAGRWITPEITRAYSELHRLGWAHSVEVVQDGALVGGLYGLAVGGLFAGESMFHRERDASKVALLGLHELLAADGDARRVIDVQWRTDHLATLGVQEVPRGDYLELLRVALTAPLPAGWA